MIADRLSIISDTVFNSYQTYGTTILIFASVCYTFQIFCDFASYSTIAVGIGKMLGFQLTHNFNAPYYASSIQEFWRRWHISLSTWFRDYVYIPLGGNRCSFLRKNCNLLITFLVSGLWHGANWTYIIWGLIHGSFQVIANITRPFRQRIYTQFHFKTECFSFRLGQRLCTFCLISFAWIFFRSAALSDAFGYIFRILTQPDAWNLFNGSIYNLGLDVLQMNILTLFLFFALWIDNVKYRTGKDIDILLMEQNWGFRGIVIILLFIVILVFGMYGPEFNAQEFIYFQF